MSFHGWVLYCAALAAMIAVPGPFIAALAPRAMTQGFGQAMGLAAGAAVGDLTWAALSLFGLAAAAQAWAPTLVLLKWGGAAYLIWIGVKLIRAPAKAVEAARVEGEGRGFAANLLSGWMITMGNPKPALFYLALMPNFFDIGALSLAQKLLVLAPVAPLILLIMAAYAGLAAQAGRLLKSPTASARVNRASGVVMIGAGVAVAVG